MDEPEDTAAASTGDSSSADKFSDMTHAEIERAYEQSKAERRKDIEHRRRQLAKDQRKLDNDTAALGSDPELSDEDEKR